jgi:hypothetical protein
MLENRVPRKVRIFDFQGDVVRVHNVEARFIQVTSTVKSMVRWACGRNRGNKECILKFVANYLGKPTSSFWEGNIKIDLM